MRRVPIVALLGASLVVGGAVVGSATAQPKLTSANSIAFEFAASSTETIRGTNCGTTATVVKQLPRGAKEIKVLKPKVGDRDQSGGGTRVTSVTVEGAAVTITVLADGPSICDPNQSGVPAGEPVNWEAAYDVRAEYKRRVQATIRIFYESYVFGAKWKLRPKTIRDTRAGLGLATRFTGLKWKRFGGKTAIGFGRARLDYCRRGDNCPLNGGRVRLVASKPAYCADSDKIEYLKLKHFQAGRLHTVYHIKCSD